MPYNPISRAILLDAKKCCDNGCVNCPYKVKCLKCNQLNKVMLDLDGFVCGSCGQGHEYLDGYHVRRTELSLEFEDGERI